MPNANDLIHHPRFGAGRVIADNGNTVVARFDHGIEECLTDDVTVVSGPWQRSSSPTWDAPLDVVTRMQAEAIQSVNDMWGVLSLSRINLLPHQLWVCRKVLESWPTRWLVADDVGLGKTIEAGLILAPLLSRRTVSRLLILCPASLVEQWQFRLRTMFDIRVAHYVPEADTPKADFWHTHTHVVASLQTLRKDHRGRQQRMVEPPWDLLIVDEAHHLNADEQSGPTLGYQFVEKLAENRKLRSMVFFTGTPHRGKNFGFLSLLKLLRPEWFDTKRPLSEQLQRLPEIMIRNNKQCVTDLKGALLFKELRVASHTYKYSDEEACFYDLLTEFITTGKAYAATLGAADQRMATLVLIAMQKLASSSVAAIRRALEGRLGRIEQSRKRVEELQTLRDKLAQYAELEDMGDFDDLSSLDEQIAEELSDLQLAEDEEPRLRQLTAAASVVKQETKISAILRLLDSEFIGQAVLFFTEYKATQSLLMSALMSRYGDDCVTFINGDGEARDVVDSQGQSRTVRLAREEAARKFNAGHVRFLVSTEAAGEGIDLQENCHTLIHVDLPWNPMRMHQRVGRLNRYGQQHAVNVVSFRNPDTVEALVWDKLTTKLERITSTLRNVMAQPEDLQQIVLGMTSPGFFRELFSEAATVPKESFSDWFDARTAKFGGRDALDAVRDLVGHSSRFDFQSVSDKLPQIDLPALRPFFVAMLTKGGRRVQESEGRLSFKTPEPWMDDPRILPEYESVEFERRKYSPAAPGTVVGVGHVLMELALREAKDQAECVTASPSDLWPHPIFIFRVSDRLTTTGSNVRATLLAVEVVGKQCNVLQDWQLLQRLNGVLEKRTLRRDEKPTACATNEQINQLKQDAESAVQSTLSSLELPFRAPEIHWIGVIWPRLATT